jgi:nucleotide-binding universal stress UspA family protein
MNSGGMIKVILVHLEGDTTPDSLRLDAARELAKLFEAKIVGLYINALPAPVLGSNVIANTWTPLVAAAYQAADATAAALRGQLLELDQPAELRRFDVFDDDIGRVYAREARAADVFLTLRPSASGTGTQEVVESVLFRGGRHLLLLHDQQSYAQGFEHAVIAWNGSREVARALSEARPYLHNTRTVTILIVGKESQLEFDPPIGEDALGYLQAHGIEARLQAVAKRGAVADSLMEELANLEADLAIMGGYGSPRLAEWLLGGTTRKLLRQSPVPLLIAH